MAKQSWTLTDVENDVFIEDFTISPDDVAGPATGFQVRKQTLRGGLREGVDAVELQAGACRVTVLPTRGMGLWRAWRDDLAIGWKSPIRGPVHPHYVPLADPSGLGWLDGFDELLVRCGLESNGAPDFDPTGRLLYPLHGHIANRPAHRVDVTVDGDTGEVSLTGLVDESRFHFQKLRLASTVTLRPDDPAITIQDRVTNLSGDAAEMQLLYHVNLGPPILEPNAQVVLPAATVAPRDAVAAAAIDTWDTYAPEQAGFAEQVAFMQLRADPQDATRALLRNASGRLGISLIFNINQLPCFTLWKNTPSEVDGYVTGLEPGTNFPNTRTFETAEGRTVRLEPGESATFDIRIEIHANAAEVQAAEAAVDQLRGAAATTVLDQPRKGWSL